MLMRWNGVKYYFASNFICLIDCMIFSFSNPWKLIKCFYLTFLKQPTFIFTMYFTQKLFSSEVFYSNQATKSNKRKANQNEEYIDGEKRQNVHQNISFLYQRTEMDLKEFSWRREEGMRK